MLKAGVQTGETYMVMVSGVRCRVRLLGPGTPRGYVGLNLRTNREIHIKSAGRLRRPATKTQEP